eukprot:Partr_v1_DN26955_c1_g1_i2_m7239 putative UTP6, small subunit (SSU) processome component, homolog (yeast)
MAESVQRYLESTLPELKDLQARSILSELEIKSIVKKRTDFEYALRRRGVLKEDFMKYIAYERSLEDLRRRRKKRLNITGKPGESEFSIVRRIHFLYDRATKTFPADVDLWVQHVKFSRLSNSSSRLGKIFASALQFCPRSVELWTLAASWEWEDNKSVVSARSLYQRAIRFNAESRELWLSYFRLEMLFLDKLMERKRVLGISSDIVVEEDGDVETGEAMSLVLKGAIPLAIFKNACLAFSGDFKFQLRFLEQSLEFSELPLVADEIRLQIEKNFGDGPDVYVPIIACELPALDAPDFSVKFRSVMEKINALAGAEAFKPALIRFLLDLHARLGSSPSSAVVDVRISEFVNSSILSQFDGLTEPLPYETLVDSLMFFKDCNVDKYSLLADVLASEYPTKLEPWKHVNSVKLFEYIKNDFSMLEHWQLLISMDLPIDHAEEIFGLALKCSAQNFESKLRQSIASRYLQYFHAKERGLEAIRRDYAILLRDAPCPATVIAIYDFEMSLEGMRNNSIIRKVLYGSLDNYAECSDMLFKLALKFEKEEAKDIKQYSAIADKLRLSSDLSQEQKDDIYCSLL